LLKNVDLYRDKGFFLFFFCWITWASKVSFQLILWARAVPLSHMHRIVTTLNGPRGDLFSTFSSGSLQLPFFTTFVCGILMIASELKKKKKILFIWIQYHPDALKSSLFLTFNLS
jgi:hypothetical protein